YNLDAYLNTNKEVVFGIRPEDLKEGKDETNPSVKVKVDVVEALGSETLIYCKTKDKWTGEEESVVTDVSNLIAKVGFAAQAKAGDVIDITIDVERAQIFDKDTEITIVAKDESEKEIIAQIQEEKKEEMEKRAAELALKEAEEAAKREKKLAKRGKKPVKAEPGAEAPVEEAKEPADEPKEEVKDEEK
ncbi:MAG: hypothetical protein J5697_02625, partial [Clostridia bacterium]|nr:hypothetical protein [Clostridia bacterium]